MVLTATRPSPAPGARGSAAVPHADAAWDVLVVVVVNAVVVVGLWIRHGGVSNSVGPGGAMIAVGQLAGLLGAYAVLVQLLLMARVPWLERHIGLDGLARWHRWNGFTAVSLVVAHAVAITLGYAASNRVGVLRQFGDFLTHYADVLMALVGTVVLTVVAASSIRLARAALSRESWYFVHLYAYVAVALGFAHQLATGSDFIDDPLARAWWVGLYVVVLGGIALWRVGWPLWFNARHQLRVAKIVNESPDVVSVYITGRDLGSVRAQAGQFFLWRFRTRDRWWQAHPFSLSADPDGQRLRITVKGLGDFSRRVGELRRGTRVFAEGPYGVFTTERRTCEHVVLIAGGIGITPIRAMLEALSAEPGDITLLYRAARPDDLVFRAELERLARAQGIVLHLLVGEEIGDDSTDQLGAPALAALVPDIRDRDVFVCGPPALLDAVDRRLRQLGVPRRQIHNERFAY